MEFQMFVTPAFAQAAAPGGGAFDGLAFQIMPFLLIFVIMYFLVIRPQQRRMKQHRTMLASIRRGDTVVTTGGIIGKVTKVIDEQELELQIADNVKVRVARPMVSDVRAKGEPVANDA
jgi:preprotein translocase subunit YajC